MLVWCTFHRIYPYLTGPDGEGGSVLHTFPPPLDPTVVSNASANQVTRLSRTDRGGPCAS